MVVKTVIAVVGDSGSGKTWLTRRLHDTGIVPNVVSYTTRPPRPGEKDGVDHLFVTEEDWRDVFSKKETLAYTFFGGFRYWTLPEQITEDFMTYVIDEKGLLDLQERFSDRFNIVSVHVTRPDNPTDPERRRRDSERTEYSDYGRELVNDGTETFWEIGRKHVQNIIGQTIFYKKLSK